MRVGTSRFSLFRAAQTIRSSAFAEPAFCVGHSLIFSIATNAVEISLEQSLRGHVDFPRYYPWTFRKIRVGFTDMSRCTERIAPFMGKICLTRQGISLFGSSHNICASE